MVFPNCPSKSFAYFNYFSCSCADIYWTFKCSAARLRCQLPSALSHAKYQAPDCRNSWCSSCNLLSTSINVAIPFEYYSACCCDSPQIIAHCRCLSMGVVRARRRLAGNRHSKDGRNKNRSIIDHGHRHHQQRCRRAASSSPHYWWARSRYIGQWCQRHAIKIVKSSEIKNVYIIPSE